MLFSTAARRMRKPSCLACWPQVTVLITRSTLRSLRSVKMWGGCSCTLRTIRALMPCLAGRHAVPKVATRLKPAGQTGQIGRASSLSRSAMVASIVLAGHLYPAAEAGPKGGGEVGAEANYFASGAHFRSQGCFDTGSFPVEKTVP